MAGQESTANRLEAYREVWQETPALFTVGDKTYLGNYADYWTLRQKTEEGLAVARTPEEREAVVQRYSPTDETPDPVFSTLDRAVDAGIIAWTAGAITGALGGAMEWLSGFDLPSFDFVSTGEAIDAGGAAVDWGGLDIAVSTSQEAAIAADAAIPGFSMPSWASDLGSWGLDLGKSAVQQWVKQEVAEEFSPTGAMATRSAVNSGSTLRVPQTGGSYNPLAGLLSMISPSRTAGVPQYSAGGYIGSAGGGSGGGGGGASGGGLPIGLIVAAVVAVFGLILLLRR